MVFDDYTDVCFGAVFCQLQEPVRRQLLLFCEAELAVATSVDANGVTTKVFGSVYPLMVIRNCLRPFGLVRISQGALTVDHDQDTLHTGIGSSLLHLIEVFAVLRFVLKELIDVFHPFDAEFLGGRCEFKVVHLGA